MKRLIICFFTLAIMIVGVVLVADSFESVAVSEDAKAEYGSCQEHTYDSDYTVINEPTCKDKGIKWRACSVCGYIDRVETPKNPDNHTQVKDEWLYFPVPTCVKGGTKYKVCYACNGHLEVTDVPVDPEAHSASGEKSIIVEASCEKYGVEADICKHCGELFNYVTTSKNPEVHVVSDDSRWEIKTYSTCTVGGTYVCYCDFCGEIAITKSYEPTGYHYHDGQLHVDKEATCSQPGVMSYHCVECGMSMEEQEIPVDSQAHVYSEEFIVDVEATCVSAGEKSKHCTECGERKDITEIPVNVDAHAFSDEWIVTKEATCSSMGLKHTVCTLCAAESIPVATAKSDHTYGDYEVIQMSADGLSAKVRYTCTVCGNEKEDIIVYDQNNGNGDVGDGNDYSDIFKLIPREDSVIVVDYDKLIVSNIARNMTIAKFNNNFTNSNRCVIYDIKNNVVSEESLISTGFRINYEDITGIVTNYYVSVTGDLDSDGKVTAADARLLLRASAGLHSVSGAYFIAADVNMDGKITAADARKTLRVSATIDYFESTYKN